MKLTDAACRAAKKAESIYYLPAGDGLRLMIHPNAGKYWCVRYYMDDKEKTARVGHYPDVGLKAAKLQRNAVQKGRRKVRHHCGIAFIQAIRLVNSIENITVEKSTDELRKELAQLMGSVIEADDEEEPVTLN